MPLSMMGIGVVTMISQLTGRYGLAGALSATIALAAAVAGPAGLPSGDRYGQRRVLRPGDPRVAHRGGGRAAAGRALRLAGLGAVRVLRRHRLRAESRRDGPARWAALYRGTPQLHTAYSFESVVDEICFIFGPIISIGLSTAWFPEAGPLLAACFLAAGVFWLTAQRATEPEPHPRQHKGGGTPLRSRGLQVLVVTFAATGTIFGAIDVVTVAFAEEEGHKAAASLVLALYAAGSCTGGHDLRADALRRAAGTALAAGRLCDGREYDPLLLVGNLLFLAAALFVAGLSIAPTMITTMSLIEEHVPRTQLTEGMTWVSTGLAVGVALGSSAGGWVIDASGARAGYWVPAVAGAVAVAVGFLGYRRLKRPEPRRGGDR